MGSCVWRFHVTGLRRPGSSSSQHSTKVKSAILADPALKVAQINVETYKGTVQLSGFVDSAESRDKAVALARSVEGVRSVQNSMQLR